MLSQSSDAATELITAEGQMGLESEDSRWLHHNTHQDQNLRTARRREEGGWWEG